MTENITLPREVVEKARRALKPLDHYMTVYDRDEIADTLRTALAAEPTKPSEEAEALRRDAERYRLLRRGQRWSVINGIGDALRAEALDAAIDAAMKEAALRREGT